MPLSPGFRCALLATALAAVLPSIAAAGNFRLLRVDGVNVKWDEPILGHGAVVSYGFSAAAVSFPGATNCGALAPMSGLAAAWQRDPARLEAVAEAAVGMWSRAADVRFRAAAPGETPDILIGAQGVPKGIAFADVWHGPSERGVAPITRAAVCFNPDVAWTTEDGPTPPNVYDLATVLAHEIGHALGLDHPGPRGALMAYSNQGPIDALMPGDVEGAVLLYGPASRH
jgi:Matrixin